MIDRAKFFFWVLVIVSPLVWVTCLGQEQEEEQPAVVTELSTLLVSGFRDGNESETDSKTESLFPFESINTSAPSVTSPPPSPPPSFSSNSPVNCQINETNETHIAEVKLVNSSQLFDYLTNASSSQSNQSSCHLILFYYPWCPFSAQAAISYNALGALYPQIHVLALDAYEHNSINMRFGLVGIPTILFFHSGKMIAKFNHTEVTLENLNSFLKRITGLEPDDTVKIEDLDLTGPVPIVPEPMTDYVLIVSSLFLFISLVYLIIKSTIFKKISDSIRNTWREAEAQHEHLE
ncbi:thioredoxin domain-containing protein bug [Brevipalpus obovatus]|uniref:thioredoxin domain-containing protein bug n=1 Tax=Brevipalpus obovatus TaxID=246614 RepID=UPI003D9F7F9E